MALGDSTGISFSSESAHGRKSVFGVVALITVAACPLCGQMSGANCEAVERTPAVACRRLVLTLFASSCETCHDTYGHQSVWRSHVVPDPRGTIE